MHPGVVVEHGTRGITGKVHTNALNDLLSQVLNGVKGFFEGSVVPLKPQKVDSGGEKGSGNMALEFFFSFESCGRPTKEETRPWHGRPPDTGVFLCCFPNCFGVDALEKEVVVRLWMRVTQYAVHG